MELTTELNGIKYLVVEVLATQKSEKELTKKAEKYEAIYQGIKEVNTGGFWGNAYAVIRILVPEKNVVAFNSDKD